MSQTYELKFYTHILRHLDEGKAVLYSLSRKRTNVEGCRERTQASGRYNFSLKLHLKKKVNKHGCNFSQ